MCVFISNYADRQILQNSELKVCTCTLYIGSGSRTCKRPYI